MLPAGDGVYGDSHYEVPKYYRNGPKYTPLASPPKVNTHHTTLLFDLRYMFRPSGPSSFDTTSILTILGAVPT
jgi:hypothetical protein